MRVRSPRTYEQLGIVERPHGIKGNNQLRDAEVGRWHGVGSAKSKRHDEKRGHAPLGCRRALLNLLVEAPGILRAQRGNDRGIHQGGRTTDHQDRAANNEDSNDVHTFKYGGTLRDKPVRARSPGLRLKVLKGFYPASGGFLHPTKEGAMSPKKAEWGETSDYYRF